MAITKIHAIKTTLNKALAYIENPEKTDHQLLVSGYNCDPLMASVEFQITTAAARELRGNRVKTGGGNNLAYHMIQSFAPGEVQPEEAHEIGKQLADRFLGGKYEYVLSTHVDKGHIHNHIILNAVSFYDYKKLVTAPYKTAREIRSISDQLCAEHNLSVIREPQLKGKSYSELHKPGRPAFRTEIRKRVNFALQYVRSMEELLSAFADMGMEMDATGKNTKYRMKGQQRWTRADKLSDEDAYAYNRIAERLEANASAQNEVAEIIREILPEAKDYADFCNRLQERGVKIKRLKGGKAAYIIDQITVPEETVSSQNIKDAFAYGTHYGLLKDQPEKINIAEKFAELSQQKASETAVMLPETAIEKITENGILVRINETKRAFFDNAMLDLKKGAYTAWIGSRYNYHVTEGQEQTSMKGEELLRALDLQSGSQPVQLRISGEDLKTIGSEGITLSLPEIGKVFIESRYVSLDRENGECLVSLYKKWNYRVSQGSETVEDLTGENLAAMLKSREANSSRSATTIEKKIRAMEKRRNLSDIKEIAEMLSYLREHRIDTTSDLKEKIDDLAASAKELREAAEKQEEKISLYKLAVKYLTTAQRYAENYKSYMDLRGKKREQYGNRYNGELEAYRYAVNRLDELDVGINVDVGKVMSLIKVQEKQVAEFRRGERQLSDEIKTLQKIEQQLDNLQDQNLLEEEKRKRQ